MNFVVTIHNCARQHEFSGVCHYSFGLYQLHAAILATPVLAITLLLCPVSGLLGIGIFDPQLGGDPVLFQHFFWFTRIPAVYIMILPAMGVVSVN